MEATAKEKVFLLYSHRGASAYAPENTMAAFQRAIEMGAPRIELDVHLSADGVPVVIHDDTLERTTNGKGKAGNFTLSDLKKLDAGGWYAGSFRGEKIPTLEEALALSRKGAKFCIEIKEREREEECCVRVVDLVKKSRLAKETVISSFSISALGTSVKIGGGMKTLWLVDKGALAKDTAGKACNLGVVTVSAHAADWTARQVKTIHSAGLTTQAWGTSNDEIKLNALLDTGIDGMTSNWPDIVMKMLTKRGWRSM